jgi:demethylmenaquinone methyltransferase/2-methoxy-6-polyprenyl-1,4-benzoquinol methylase
MKLDKSEERVRRMFGQIAHRYDRMNHLLSMNVDRYWRRKAVSLVPADGTAPILDLCTGTGDLAFAYHRATRGRVPIVAADFCREMLVLGDQKKHSFGINGQVRFVEADAQQLPFSADHFQLACVAFGLRNVTSTRRGLSEMVRVVNRNGKVAVLEFSKPRWPPFSWIYAGYFRFVLPRLGQWLARNDLDAYEYLPASVGEFPSGEGLAQLMREAGLRDVWYRALTLGIATLYVGTK